MVIELFLKRELNILALLKKKSAYPSPPDH